MVLDGAISERNFAGGELFLSHTLLKLFECCVEWSIHFLFIFLSNSCGMSLNTNFGDMKYYSVGVGHGPPALTLGSTFGVNPWLRMKGFKTIKA